MADLRFCFSLARNHDGIILERCWSVTNDQPKPWSNVSTVEDVGKVLIWMLCVKHGGGER